MNIQELLESIGLNPGNILDLTRNYPQYTQLLARIENIRPGGKVDLLIVKAVSTHKKPPFVLGQKITVAPNYIKRAPIVAESHAYKVSKAERRGIADINREFDDIAMYMNKDIYQELASAAYHNNASAENKLLKVYGYKVIRTGDAAIPIILRSVKNPDHMIKYRAQDL